MRTDLTAFDLYLRPRSRFSHTDLGGEGVLPYMGYIGMCGPTEYGFSAVLVINRVSNLADSGHK